MSINEIFCIMLLVNGHSALTLRNFLFNPQLIPRNASLQHTTKANTFHRNTTNIENGTEKELVKLSVIKYEQHINEAQPTSLKIFRIYMTILIISNTVFIIFGLILACLKIFTLLKRKLKKRNIKVKYDRRKRKNIVNNPHSGAYFEDF
jgi:hypothetical protein